MEKNKNIFISVSVVVAAVVISAIAFRVFQPNINVSIDKVVQDGTTATLGGQRGGLQEFTDGITPGSATEKWEKVSIDQNSNQGSWRNDTGDTVYISPYDTFLFWETGTASSGLRFYVGTSTTATFTDFARPTPSQLLIDGAIVATSTASGSGRHNIYVGTTTPTNGLGFEIPSGDYLVFDIQERFFCKSVGSCETATSSNRGINRFIGLFKWRKNP